MPSHRISRRTFSAASASALVSLGMRRMSATPEADTESIQAQQESLYPERDWDVPRNGEINLSGFTYRDTAADGIYGLDDQPFLGVWVELTAPDGNTTRRRSNSNGFSNFAASNTLEDAVIRVIGEYTFTVIPPPGFYVTTGNQRQVIPVTEHPGSIGGLVMPHLPYPFGIAPELSIRGNVESLLQVYEDSTLVAVDPDGMSHPIQAESDGTFTLPASMGEWQIGGPNSAMPPRQVTVAHHPVVLSSLPEAHSLDELAMSVTLGFDDIAPGSTLRKVPNGYGGLNWSGLNAISNIFASGEGYTNNTQSGEYVAYSSSGHAVVISSDRQFDFIGGFFGIAWPSAEGETIRARAWQGETLVAEDAFTGSAWGAVYFAANYRGITTLELSTDHYWQFVVDDMEFIVPV